jgi:HK97 family phage major capsid protein
VYLADVDVPFSYQIQMDAVDFVRELSRVMQDAIVQLTKTGYTTSTGSTQPKGYVPNATAPTRTAAAFTAADVHLLQNSLPPRFSATRRGLPTSGDQYDLRDRDHQWLAEIPEIREAPPRLLTKPVHENSNQSGDMTTAASRSSPAATSSNSSSSIWWDPRWRSFLATELAYTS